MFYQLPPAGERVALDTVPDANAVLSACFAPYSAKFFGSGTSALAASIRAAAVRRRAAAPEVLLPAYACPDLVSAALAVQVQPRLVDVSADRPWMDLDELQRKITSNTVAVVAADFLGIPERHGKLRQVTQDAGIVLIQDSAQSFPRRGEKLWQGDYVVLSFGRGKPVTLLGGGAVLCRDASLEELLPEPPVGKSANGRTTLSYRARAQAYNALRSPYGYWLPATLPFLHLGETRFRPLSAITGAWDGMETLLAANIVRYWNRPDSAQAAIRAMLKKLASDSIADLAAQADPGAGHRLLRYPVLVRDASLRDQLFRSIQRAGLGGSTMYGRDLASITGLTAESSDDQRFPNARSFASRVLTLPVHSGVRDHDIGRLADLLSQALGVPRPH